MSFTVRGFWRRLPPAVRFVLPLFVAVRVGLSLFAALSLRAFPPTPIPIEYMPEMTAAAAGPRGGVLGPWQRWDAFWYLQIATRGYHPTDGSTAFFPLYPLAIRLLAPLVGGDYLLAATFISNVACLAAIILLYQITQFELDHGCARRTVVYQLIFPTAFFLFAPYTESLFLLWVMVCLYAGRRGHWWTAGTAAFLASLTRSTGALLFVPLAYEKWRQAGSVRGLLVADSLALGLAPLGVVVYSLYLAAHLGSPLLWLNSQDQALWNRGFAWPWETIQQIAAHLFRPLNNTVDLLFTLLFVVLLVLVFRKLPALYGLYMLCSLIPPLLTPRAGAPLYSMPRFVLVLFPGFMILGALGKRSPGWHRVIVYSSLPLLAFCVALFVAWYWVA